MVRIINKNKNVEMKTINNIKVKQGSPMIRIFLKLIPLFLFLILPMMFNSCGNKECAYRVIQDSVPFTCDSGMDVAFLIDYRESMGPDINFIKSSINSVTSAIISRSGGNYRLALSIFDEIDTGFFPMYFTQADYTSLPAANKIVNTTGPITDQYLTVMEKFSMANTASFSTQLAKLNGTMALGLGGVNPSSPGGLLLNKIVNSSFAGTWRPGLTKLAIIITATQDGGDDNLPNTVDDTYLDNLANQANLAGIECILVTKTSNSSSNYQMHLITPNIGGIPILLPDFNDISPDLIRIINLVCEKNGYH